MKSIMVSMVLFASTAALAAPKADAKKGAASAKGDECSFSIAGNDQMKFVFIKDGKEEQATEFKIPEKCRSQDIKFTLVHAGKLPKEAMGHNLVIHDVSKQQAVITAGTAAGPAKGYVPEKADGLVAATKTVGGGETTDVTVPKGSFKDGTNYGFVCSFPGHFALMKGTISFVK